MVSDIFDHVLIVRYSSTFNRANLVVNELYKQLKTKDEEAPQFYS